MSFNDTDAVGLDMLKPPRRRQLDPVLTAKQYDDARAQILAALDFATAPSP